ncbi:MAG: phosphotyrosine protein phosphatase [Candidatus Dormibacteraceae bacterium]
MPVVAFVFTQGPLRSRIAAEFLKRATCGRVKVVQVGEPSGSQIKPGLRAYLKVRHGVVLDAAPPLPLTARVLLESDLVVTMGCPEVCPIYAGRTYEDWELEDPGGLAGVDLARAVEAIEVRSLLLGRRLTGEGGFRSRPADGTGQVV